MNRACFKFHFPPHRFIPRSVEFFTFGRSETKLHRSLRSVRGGPFSSREGRGARRAKLFGAGRGGALEDRGSPSKSGEFNRTRYTSRKEICRRKDGGKPAELL